MRRIKTMTATIKNLKDSASKIQAQFEALGSRAGDADLAHGEACMLFGKFVNDGTIVIPEGDKDELKKAANKCLLSFHEAKARKNNSKCPSADSLKTYAGQYMCFADKRVNAAIGDITTAVKAYTSKRTKADMGKRGFFDILYSTASKVRKAKEGETVPLTKATFDSIVAGKATDGGVVKTPRDVALGALTGALKAVRKEGGLNKTQLAKLVEFAKSLGIEL